MSKLIQYQILVALITLGLTPVAQASTTYVFRQFVDGDGRAAPCSVTGSISAKSSGGGGSGFAASSVTVLSAKVGGGGSGGTALNAPAQPGSVNLSW